jgi:hypothetical protein
MTERRFCVAAGIAVAVLGILVWVGPAVSSTDCEIPPGLAAGKVYQVTASGGVVLGAFMLGSIDQGSCWLAGSTEENVPWMLNLRNVVLLEGLSDVPPGESPPKRPR